MGFKLILLSLEIAFTWSFYERLLTFCSFSFCLLQVRFPFAVSMPQRKKNRQQDKSPRAPPNTGAPRTPATTRAQARKAVEVVEVVDDAAAPAESQLEADVRQLREAFAVMQRHIAQSISGTKQTPPRSTTRRTPKSSARRTPRSTASDPTRGTEQESDASSSEEGGGSSGNHSDGELFSEDALARLTEGEPRRNPAKRHKTGKSKTSAVQDIIDNTLRDLTVLYDSNAPRYVAQRMSLYKGNKNAARYFEIQRTAGLLQALIEGGGNWWEQRIGQLLLRNLGVFFLADRLDDMSLVDLYCVNHYDEILPAALAVKIAQDKKHRATGGEQEVQTKRPKAKPWFNRTKKPLGHPRGVKP